MNKTLQFLNNLQSKVDSSMFGTNFVQNLKRFKHLTFERWPIMAVEFENFLNEMPDYLLQSSKDENTIVEWFQNAEDMGEFRQLDFVPADDDMVKLTLKFDNFGRIIEIILKNDIKILSFKSMQNIVNYNRVGISEVQLQSMSSKLITLKVKKATEKEFTQKVIIEKQSLDNSINENETLWGI